MKCMQSIRRDEKAPVQNNSMKDCVPCRGQFAAINLSGLRHCPVAAAANVTSVNHHAEGRRNVPAYAGRHLHAGTLRCAVSPQFELSIKLSSNRLSSLVDLSP